MGDIRKLPYRLPPALVPEKLVETRIRCPTCKAEQPVPWLESMEFPKQPVAPLVGGGHWVPISIPVPCTSPECGGNVFDAQIPIIPNESRWTLYGDEAGRFIQTPLKEYSATPLYFFCITLVGLHRNRHDRVRNRFARLKKRIAPDRDPAEWCHHFSDIWNSDGRAGEYRLPNKEAKIAHAQSVAQIIREARPELVTFNVSGCARITSTNTRADVIKSVNQEVFCISILTSAEQMRAQKKGVHWVYDNIKDVTTGARTEGWAMEVFLGLQYTRLFAWIAGGSAVLPPDFVAPGSHYLLEIADFVSYSVARDFEKAAQGLRNEIPSSHLGPGLYQAVLSDGSVDYEWSHGLPLKKFFGVA